MIYLNLYSVSTCSAFLDFSIFLQNTFTIYKGAKLRSPPNADALPVLMPLSNIGLKSLLRGSSGNQILEIYVIYCSKNTVTNVLALPQKLWLGFSQHWLCIAYLDSWVQIGALEHITIGPINTFFKAAVKSLKSLLLLLHLTRLRKVGK